MVPEVISYERGLYDVVFLHLDYRCVQPDAFTYGSGVFFLDLAEITGDIPQDHNVTWTSNMV
jgi:hypothetical protein